MDFLARAFLILCIVMSLVTIGLGLWLYIDSKWLEKRRFEHFKRGYLTAVNDIINHEHFVDPDTKKVTIISIAAIDGETTPYWEKKFEEYSTRGFEKTIDVFVKHGIMNKRTGDKFKRRYAEENKGDTHDKD